MVKIKVHDLGIKGKTLFVSQFIFYAFIAYIIMQCLVTYADIMGRGHSEQYDLYMLSLLPVLITILLEGSYVVAFAVRQELNAIRCHNEGEEFVKEVTPHLAMCCFGYIYLLITYMYTLIFHSYLDQQDDINLMLLSFVPTILYAGLIYTTFLYDIRRQKEIKHGRVTA